MALRPPIGAPQAVVQQRRGLGVGELPGAHGAQTCFVSRSDDFGVPPEGEDGHVRDRRPDHDIHRADSACGVGVVRDERQVRLHLRHRRARRPAAQPARHEDVSKENAHPGDGVAPGLHPRLG